MTIEEIKKDLNENHGYKIGEGKTIVGMVWNAAIDACRDQINTSYSEWPEYTDETLGYHQKQLKAIDSLRDPQGE